MSDIKFRYIILKLLLLTIFFIFGHILSKARTKREYWSKAWMPILAYALVEGLRFGRLIDWNVYYFRYINLGQSVDSESYEFLFESICNILYNLGFSYPAFIFLQCAFLMYTILVLISNFRKHATFILPMILLVISGNENFIRWYIAFSFFLLSMNSILKNDHKRMILWFVCAFLNHAGIIVFAPLLLFYKLFNSVKIDKKVALGLLFATCFVLTLSHLSFLIGIANFLISKGMGNLGGISGYLTQVESLLNGEFGRTSIMERSLSNNIRHFIAVAPIIWYGRECMKQDKYGTLIYNLFVIGTIVLPLFSLIEIFNRYGAALFFFFAIVGGTTFTKILKRKFYNTNAKIYLVCLACFLATIWPYFSDVISREDDRTMFIWDSNGQDFLPYWQNTNDLIKDINKR